MNRIIKFAGFAVIVNFRQWGLSRDKYDVELGPIMVDWEQSTIKYWRESWVKRQHPYWVLQQRKPNLAFIKWTYEAFAGAPLRSFKHDIKTLRNLATGTKVVRAGGVATGNVVTDIRYGNGAQTRAWAALPKNKWVAWVAFKRYPEAYGYCLKAMTGQERVRCHQFDN